MQIRHCLTIWGFTAVLATVFAVTGGEAQARLTVDHGCCAAPVCQTTPHITYKDCSRSRGCSVPSLKIVTPVTDPGCCKCIVEVPMCIPACCTDAPLVSSRCGHFGRGVVLYEWCCGFKAKVAFSRCGDIRVTYFGRY